MGALSEKPSAETAVPGPFGPKEIPSTLVFAIIPSEVYAKIPAPQGTS